MNILSKLPIGMGNQRYEPNFHVDVRGLDRMVQQAVSGKEAEYSLGSVALDSRLTGIKVMLKTSINTSSYGNYSYTSPSYTLEAVIEGNERKPTLPTDTSLLKGNGFGVTEGGDNTFLHIRSVQRFGNGVVQYSGQRSRGALTYSRKASGMTPEEVKQSIIGFAEALEHVVNGIYMKAKAASPTKKLTLQLGTETKRIRASFAANEPVGTAGQRQPYGQQSAEQQEGGLPAPALPAVKSNVTFKDIGGYQGVKEQLQDFLLAIKNPAEAMRQGYKPSKGWLLHGPPGTGKTLFGKALAGEAVAEFVYFNAADALQMYVGQSTKALKAAFEGSQKRADETKKPVILFIDEIDSIFPKRGTAHDVKVDLVNLFNQYMDGFESQKIPNVYVVAATNRLPEMDESATRAGRFVKIEVPMPDLEARVAIFQVTKRAIEKEAGTQLFDPGIDYKPLAERTEKFSGADIADVMREARQKAFRQAAVSGQKDVVLTTVAELEEEIAAYKQQQKRDGQSKERFGFIKD